ncbi:MAG: hypothetical protein CMQ41_12085 [Gammaproteobacteria bacterium]|nr:hypothetical protein [Gammaproteobacteria bacterium]
MQVKDIALLRAYNDDRISRFGTDSNRALGWKNPESQIKRFEQLAKIGKINGHRLLDAGCGHGDLYPYLKQIYGEFEYIGLDYQREFLDVAIDRFGRYENTKFVYGEFSSQSIPVVDYVICCGALNYRNSETDYINRMIYKLFAVSKIGLGLSLLKRVEFEDGFLVPTHPAATLEFSKELTSSIVLQDDPKDDYFTLFLYREE